MGFDDLTKRMGQRHGISLALLAAPAALARRAARNASWAQFFCGIALVVIVVALMIGLAASDWSIPTEGVALVFAGGFLIVRGAQGLLKPRRTKR
jgi:hypothetical protein